MSEETDSSPEDLPTPAAASEPRVRRISTPRPKKAAKSAAPAVEPEPAAEPAPAEIVPADAPDDSEAPQSNGSDGDWPEPEAASTGNPSQSEGAKRKRRRRKGKGKGEAPQNAVAPVQDQPAAPVSEAVEPAEAAPRPPIGPKPPQPQPQHQPQRPKVDPELLTKMAWKIYLAEVSEEGVALIGDNDAKDLSRRCFRLAEIFIEEQLRRR